MQSIQEAYAQEMLKAQIELQEHLLGNISAEIHDNLGQLLSLIKLNLNGLTRKLQSDEGSLVIIDETKSLVSTVINDMRNISKTLSPEFISAFGLEETLRFELDRIQRTGLIKTSFAVKGEALDFDPKVKIVLFRVTQEILNNAIKHSEATKLEVSLKYTREKLVLKVADDGKGFDLAEVTTRDIGEAGAGLQNMKNRVEIVGGILNLESEPGKGTHVVIELNAQKQQLNH